MPNDDEGNNDDFGFVTPNGFLPSFLLPKKKEV